MQFSVIIPAYNEALSLEELIHEIQSTMIAQNSKYEIILVDDGSTDHTKQVMEQLISQNSRIQYLRLTRNFGKAAALHAGIAHSSGMYLITLDADLQDVPAEIPKLISKMEQGYDLIVGWKVVRHDPITKKLPSKLFNYFTNKVAHTTIHDHNSGLKIMSRDVAETLPLYGDLHRYIPALAAIQGYRISEVSVTHRPRKFGKTKYGAKRLLHGFFDIITVFLITRYSSKPMHLFGYIGLFIFIIGLCFGIYVTFAISILNMRFSDRPIIQFAMLAMLCMILGVQIGITGIIGELINYNKRDPARYYTIKSRSNGYTSSPRNKTL